MPTYTETKCTVMFKIFIMLIGLSPNTRKSKMIYENLLFESARMFMLIWPIVEFTSVRQNFDGVSYL